MSKNLSRRNFLKTAAASALSLTAFGAVATAAAEEAAVVGQKTYMGTFDLIKNTALNPIEKYEAQKSTLVQAAASAVPLASWKTNPLALPKMTLNGVRTTTSDAELQFAKMMGIDAVELSFTDDELDNFDAMKALVERVRNFPNGGFDIVMCTNGKIQKCTSIHLAYDDRDWWIERTKNFMKSLAALNCDTMCIAWQPFGISRSGDTAKTTSGANFSASDLEKILDKPLKGDRLYTQEEMWETYKYFIDAILPTCEETGVRIAIHPNDPPVPYLDGIGSLIISADDYRRAFEVAGNSPYIGAKFCFGCALEGGKTFSDNLLYDIDEFVRKGQIFQVHFRNVTAPLDEDYTGYFEECLASDGYADMYAIMLQLIKSGFNDSIFCDHSFSGYDKDVIGANTGKAVSNAWIQGLIYGARTQLAYELAK